jgi:hypothetical protein
LDCRPHQLIRVDDENLPAAILFHACEPFGQRWTAPQGVGLELGNSRAEGDRSGELRVGRQQRFRQRDLIYFLDASILGEYQNQVSIDLVQLDSIHFEEDRALSDVAGPVQRRQLREGEAYAL